MAAGNQQGAGNGSSSLAKQTVETAGLGEFGRYLKNNAASIQKIAASTIDPQQFAVAVHNCVSMTPALQKCTMTSILRASLQAASLGLTVGNALGEAYLVPYGNQCVLIPGYRGLCCLAFRSGFVTGIIAREVYEGEEFQVEYGLEPKLRYVPSEENPDPKKITHVFSVVTLKGDAKLYDVMTRAEVQRIRQRSKAGSSGPWVTDYAEMAKKTVLRRVLKLAPMSVEMSKALAADNAADTGDMSLLEFDGITIDGETGEVVGNGTEARKTGVDAVKEKLGIGKDAPEPQEAAPGQMSEDEVKASLIGQVNALVGRLKLSDATRINLVGTVAGADSLENATVDGLIALKEHLEGYTGKHSA